MKKSTRIALTLFVMLACIGSDQITKAAARNYLPKMKALSFAGDTLRLDYNENKGAVFSFEYFLPERWRGDASTAGVSFLLGALISYLLTAPAMSPMSVLGLSVFCGGVLGNLLDRVILGGNVTDFLNLGWGYYRTGIFNLADAAIAAGLLLSACSILWSLLSWASRHWSHNATGQSSRARRT